MAYPILVLNNGHWVDGNNAEYGGDCGSGIGGPSAVLLRQGDSRQHSAGNINSEGDAWNNGHLQTRIATGMGRIAQALGLNSDERLALLELP